MSNVNQHRGNKHRSFSVLHRSLGLAVAVFVVVLAITGLLLNHTSELGLKQKHLHIPWLNQMYGLRAPACTAAYVVDSRWLSLWDGRVFLDGHALDVPLSRQLHGAFVQEGLLVVVSAEQLSLFSMQGELVDRIDYPAQRSPSRAGKDAQAVVLEFTEPALRLQLNQGLTALEAVQTGSNGGVIWAEKSALPETLRASIAQDYQGEGITLERLVLDVHSGRIAGRLGVYVMDAVAIGMLLLVMSGAALGWLRRRKGKSPAGDAG